MSSTPQRQFVELHDLSPALQQDNSYNASRYNDSQSPESGHQRGYSAEHFDSDQTYNENDTSSQSPIVENEKHTKIHRRKAWKEKHEKRRVTKAGKFYRKVMGISFIFRWILFILPLAILLAVPIIVGAFKTDAALGGVRIVWLFLWIEVVWLGLWTAKLFARMLPYIFRFVVSVVSVSTTKYAGILKALEIPISLFFWALIALSTFSPIMTRNPTQRALGETGLKPWESIMAKILTAAFFSTAFYLAEKVLIQLIAVNFHKVQYEMRIAENKWAVQMLTKLFTHSRDMFPRFGSDFMDEDHILEPAAFTGISQRGKSSRPGSTGAVTPMQFVNGARRVFQLGAGIVGAVGQEMSGKKQTDMNQSAYSVVVEALLSTPRTEALARRIWLSFVQEGNEAMLPEDVIEVFGADDQETAEAAFTFFDEDLNGDVSLDEMLMKCLEVGKERKAIAASLKDTDSAIGKLDAVLVVIVGIIAVFIFIALLDTSFKTLLATSATGLLSLSFIFGTTCQEIMGSLIFLFVKHPFDVSDRIVINGSQYIVQEMSLMFTILKRGDGTQVQAPNSLLNTLFIDNIRRSAAMLESLTLDVDWSTSFEKVEALRLEMAEFIQRESRDFQSQFDILITDFSTLSKLRIQMAIRHKANWQNDALRAQRRNKWMCALALAIKKLGIVGAGPGSGDPANPFVIKQVDDSKTAVDTSVQSTIGSPLTEAGRSNSLQSALDFDPTFGTRKRDSASLDVNLRREGESEQINARLPFTIAEENEALLSDEEGQGNESREQGLSRSRTRDQTDLARSSTHASTASNMIHRSNTGRRTSQRSRHADEEQRIG